MLVGLATAGLLAVRNWAPVDANAEPLRRTLAQRAEVQQLHAQIVAARGDLATPTCSSSAGTTCSPLRRYKVDATMAAQIYDAALTEGIDPDPLPTVRLESRFDSKAVSPVGAGAHAAADAVLAKWHQPDVSREQLLEPSTNLRIGFRHLRALIPARTEGTA
ncbi:MAG: hypothetical protein U0163_18630 [Gemmatimonadaceae bacterium]